MERKEEETIVLIIGGGPSGLAVAGCLTQKSIPYVILQREDCCASLWKKRAYDRCHLHLAQEFCSLPLRPHAPDTNKYMSKDEFITYIDDYVSHFKIKPRYCHNVESASYDGNEEKWLVNTKCPNSNELKSFWSTFCVIATGENSKGYIPNIPGLNDFQGEVLHSSEYKSGLQYQNKRVLVIGSGNSGMEISYDLANYGVDTSIVIRSQVHVVTKEMIYVGMRLLKYFGVYAVDNLIQFACKFSYEDLSKYGIHRPLKGPFFLKALTGRSPVIDVGTIDKIRTGDIMVLPAILKVNENEIVFENQVQSNFDTILFATGYEITACIWLENYDFILKDNGFPKNASPYHWKGENNLYCVGLSSMGLQGVSRDAQATTNDIETVWQN